MIYGNRKVHIVKIDGSWLRTTIDKCTNHDETQHLGRYCVLQHRNWLIFVMICLISKYGKLMQKILPLADYFVTVLDMCELTSHKEDSCEFDPC